MKTDIETHKKNIKFEELKEQKRVFHDSKQIFEQKQISFNLEKERFAQRQNELNKEKLSFERNKERQMAQMKQSKTQTQSHQLFGGFISTNKELKHHSLSSVFGSVTGVLTESAIPGIANPQNKLTQYIDCQDSIEIYNF
eukprot:953177_1